MRVLVANEYVLVYLGQETNMGLTKISAYK